MSVPPAWSQVLDSFDTPPAARQHDPPHAAVPSRLFTGFWYQVRAWPCARYGVARAEANDRGINRAGAVMLKEPTYDECGVRGE